MEQIAEWIQAELKKGGADKVWKNFQLIGPADAAVAKINDIYRRVLYIKHPDYRILIQVKDFLEKKLSGAPEWKKVSIQFDFNPWNG